MTSQFLERFWNKVLFTTDCWEWQASKTEKGYGQFQINYKPKRAHRISYELYNGKIPEGLQIDHLCRNTSCVNPSHLEAVTNQINHQRGDNFTNNFNRLKTHCPKGHPFTGIRNGHRICHICRASQQQNYFKKKRGRLN